LVDSSWARLVRAMMAGFRPCTTSNGFATIPPPSIAPLARRGLPPQAGRPRRDPTSTAGPRSAKAEAAQAAPQTRRPRRSARPGRRRTRPQAATLMGRGSPRSSPRFPAPGGGGNGSSSNDLEDALAQIPNFAPRRGLPDGHDESRKRRASSFRGPSAIYGFRAPANISISARRSARWISRTAAKLSGARFVILKRGLARLERAPRAIHARSAHHRAWLRRGGLRPSSCAMR